MNSNSIEKFWPSRPDANPRRAGHLSRPAEGLRIALALCIAALISLSGCGGGSDTASEPAVPVAVSATIGTAGGTIIGPDGVQLVVPPGALDGNVTITVARSSAGAPALPAGVSTSLPIYEITPHGQRFNVPVQVKIPAAAAAGADMIAWVANPGGAWSTLPFTLDGGFLVIERTSLSWYSGMGAVGACFIEPGDPYPCRWAGMGAVDARRPVQATPSSALLYDQRISPSPSGGPSVINTYMVLSQNATISVPLDFAAPPDCRNGELTVESSFDPAAPGPSTPFQTILRQPIVLGPPAPGDVNLGGIWVARYTFETPISNLPSGRQYYNFLFSCTRDFRGRLQAASGHLAPIYVEIPAQGTVPTFTQAPASAQVVAGQPAAFTAIAQGMPAPAVRWQVAPAVGAFADVTAEVGCAPTAAPTSGTQTSASCTIANTLVGNTGQRYRAVATNASAVGGVDSADAVLTITPVPAAPVITQAPLAQTTTVLSSASFNVTATGTGTLNYTWQINGTALPGASGAFSIGACSGNAVYAQGGSALTLLNLSAGCNGVSVRVVVSNGVNPNATSTGAVLTVNAAPTSWVVQASGANNILNAIHTWDGNIAWAVGSGGWITRTTSGGANWTAQIVPNVTVLFSVSAATPSVVWAVGGDSILESRDGGVTWVARSGAAGEYLYSVSAVDSVTAWAVGFNGVILKSDGFGGFVTQVAGTTPLATLVSVSAVNADSAWAVGNRRILRTTDGGANWVQLTPAVPGVLNYGGMVVAANNGITATGDAAWVTAEGGLLRTVDGGATWTLETLPGNVTPNVIVRSGGTLWAFTSGVAAKAYRSTGGGITGTWTTEAAISPSNVNMTGFTAFTPNVMWGVGDGGLIVRQ